MTPQPKPQKRPKPAPSRIARGPVRRVSKRPAAVARRKADREWSAEIKRRDEGLCQVIRPYPHFGNDAHHVISRRKLSLRHVIANGVLLCRDHHRWAHSKPVEFRAWMRAARPGSWAALEALKQEKA